jgi:hypothetical protein
MKICAVLPCVLAVDDSSTLLSLKVHTTLESGVDHLLDAVGSRNVTQMASLLQDLVEETISEAPYNLDTDVTTALNMIKTELLGDIRGALNEAHCYDQTELHDAIKAFGQCEEKRIIGAASCPEACDGECHKNCRYQLMEYYKTHITTCRSLDNWVKNFCSEHTKRTVFPKECCFQTHTTWNCQACESKHASGTVRDPYSSWLNEISEWFSESHIEWKSLHSKCVASYHSYIEKDASCDCKQAECETKNCEYDSCHYMNCEDVYQRCWAQAQKHKRQVDLEKECLERDRKIDWSATEKIECYVNVLIETPTKEQLLDTCGKTDCLNEYREAMYKKCNEICPEIDGDSLYESLKNGGSIEQWGEAHPHLVASSTHRDSRQTKHMNDDQDGATARHEFKEFDQKLGSGVPVTTIKDQATHMYDDQDVTAQGQGVRTRYRSHSHGNGCTPDKDGNRKRCTCHLDLDYQLEPCCTECEERPSIPCEGTGESTETVEVKGAYGESSIITKTVEGKLDVCFPEKTPDLHNTYMYLHYARHGFLNHCEDIDLDEEKCYHELEHTFSYAYNLCPCIDCPPKQEVPEPVCTSRNDCGKGYKYDYSQHDVKVVCGVPEQPPKPPAGAYGEVDE